MTRCSLTKHQREAFDIIERLIEENDQAPSIREIKRALGISSTGTVMPLLVSLKERGWITWLPHKSRSIAILPDAPPGGYVLPAEVEAKVHRYAADHGDTPAGAVADIVSLFFDELEGSVAA